MPRWYNGLPMSQDSDLSRRFAIETREYETAKDLLAALRPSSGDLWEMPRRCADWIFRGHADAAWDLTPSAHRQTCPDDFPFLPFMGAQISYPSPDWKEQLNIEESFVKQFCDRADHCGIPIPGDTPELREKDVAPIENRPIDFPPIRDRFLYALAQHFGIPTRLLDWSHSALTAAYFAAKDNRAGAQCKNTVKPAHLAVWAVDRTFIEETLRLRNPGAITITAPKSTNANLHAQKGLFTLVRWTADDPRGTYRIPSLCWLVRDFFHSKNLDNSHIVTVGRYPVLVKYMLPSTEAGHLLWYLSREHIDARTVYPGLGGIVESMREPKLHQTPT